MLVSKLDAGVRAAAQDLESDMARFQEHGKTIMLWRDLVGVNMVRSVGSVAFVFFRKGQLLRVTKMTLGWDRLLAHVRESLSQKMS